MPISKFEDPTRATVNEDRGTRDAFIIRVAEMYLIVAEAGLYPPSGNVEASR